MTNTESKVIREVATGKISSSGLGRWSPPPLDGPDHRAASTCCRRRSRHPGRFRIGGVRVSVAGMPEADDAMMMVCTADGRDRASRLLEVNDGDPKFKKIEGTSVQYATNTQSQVLYVAEVLRLR